MISDPVLITGVGKRVGLSLAETFLGRGIPVIGTFRTPRESIEKLGHKGAELYQCDFNSASEVASLANEVSKKHRALRAIIHNASDWAPEANNHNPSDLFSRMMRVHAGAPYELNLALENLLHASQNEHADIIHIGDYVSSRGSDKHIAYAASKAAQDNLTLSFAKKLGPKVKVNSIAPSLVLFNESDDEQYKEKTLKKSLMQREGGLKELEALVDYLMSSQYVTGRILPLDGGRHLV